MSYVVILVTIPMAAFWNYDKKYIDLKHHKLVFAAQALSGAKSFSVELHRGDKKEGLPIGNSTPHYERITNVTHFKGIYCGKTSLSEQAIVEHFNSYPGWNKGYMFFSNDCQTLAIYMLAWLGLDMESTTSDFQVKPDSNSDREVCRELIKNVRNAYLKYSHDLSFIHVR